MKVFTENGSLVNLTNSNFLASGGEGNVFVSKQKAYKIYQDRNKAINPLKIKELSILAGNTKIIRPLGAIVDNKNRVIGYEMAQVPKGSITVCEFSSRGYQKANGITLDQVAKLAELLRQGVSFIHQNKILIVDLNEMNFLLQGKDIYYIDVDSYQTPHFPATAIMEHIRDYSTKKWTEGSDWYSWGILTFQMFTGTHPFKGRHPDFGKHDLVERMKKNVSVFNRGAKLPKNCIPLNNLPQGYKDWAKAIFEEGKRITPPVGLMVGMPIPTVPTPVAKSTKSIDILTIHKEKTLIRDFFSVGATEIIVPEDGVTINGRHYPITVEKDSIVALDQRQKVPIAAMIVGHTVEIKRLTDGARGFLEADADSLFRSNGRLYIKTQQGAILEVRSIGKRASYSTSVVANVLPRSSKIIGEGVLYEAFGQWFLVMIPREGESYQIKLPELAKKKIITARGQGNIFMATVSNKGLFSRWVFRLNNTYNSYDCWEEKNIQPAHLSFTLLPTKICAFLNENNKLELFNSLPGGIRKLINDDQAIPPGTELKAFGTNVAFIDRKEIKRVKTK